MRAIDVLQLSRGKRLLQDWSIYSCQTIWLPVSFGAKLDSLRGRAINVYGSLVAHRSFSRLWILEVVLILHMKRHWCLIVILEVDKVVMRVTRPKEFFFNFHLLLFDRIKLAHAPKRI